MSISISANDFKKTRESKGKSLIDFPNDYCVVDIETTGFSPKWDVIIEIGALKFRDRTQIDAFSSLLKPNDFRENMPYLNNYIVNLTGITDDMLAFAPPTPSVISEFRKFLGDDIIIGHNVNFDINFLYDKSIDCGLSPLSNNFVDTMRISKKLHPEFPHHRLIDLAEYYSIDPSGAHRSLVDASITAKCYSCIQQEIITNYQSLESFTLLKKQKRKRYHYQTRACDISPSTDIFDAENPFYNKTCVFTGTLEKMVRKNAMQIIADLGGINADTVTKKTNFLILGNNDYCKSIKDGKSSKHKKAEKYKTDGLDIEIIPEDVFYDMISDFLVDT